MEHRRKKLLVIEANLPKGQNILCLCAEHICPLCSRSILESIIYRHLHDSSLLFLSVTSPPASHHRHDPFVNLSVVKQPVIALAKLYATSWFQSMLGLCAAGWRHSGSAVTGLVEALPWVQPMHSSAKAQMDKQDTELASHQL